MNALIISVCIIVIIIMGHLYLKNILTNTNQGLHNILGKSNKSVTFDNKENVRYIPNNETLKKIALLTPPPDNILMQKADNQCSELTSNDNMNQILSNHVDTMYQPEDIVYNEKMYKKDSLSGNPDKSDLAFSNFKDTTDYYPYTMNNRELVNKFNNYNTAHFTDDNFDLSTFFNENNKEFNDTTSAFVDNANSTQIKDLIDSRNTLIAPELVEGADSKCDPFASTINKNHEQLNKPLVSNNIVSVNGLNLESWNYENEKEINGGKDANGLQGYSSFDDEFSSIDNEQIGQCMQ